MKKDDSNIDLIDFWLRIDPKRRKNQHKNEVIQFEYNINSDDPAKVAMEMVGGCDGGGVLESSCWRVVFEGWLLKGGC